MIFKSNIFNLNFENAVGYLTFKHFEKFDFLKHGFSTRLGGISENEFFSMNLGFNRGDKIENVSENYHLICKAIGMPFESLVASSQDHKTYIRVVTEKDKGVGIYRPKDMESVDALLTNIPGISLVTYYADCVPLFFLDPRLKVIGLAHAGWRGTVAKIGEKMINKMQELYACKASDVIVGIGPSIGPCCYEVDLPVAKQFQELSELNTEKFITDSGNEKYKVNLWETNKQILLNAGVLESNIYVTDMCTNCMHDLLISHRKTGGKRGTMAAIMYLNP